MALDEATIDAIFAEVNSVVQRTGYFDASFGHEPKSAPEVELACATYLQSLRPVALVSGLAATSARMEITASIYTPFKSMPEDLIDLNVAKAAAAIITAFSGDFDLAGLVRNIDLLGAHGEPLGARAGYQSMDRTVYRIMDITIPLIISDAFPQAQ